VNDTLTEVKPSLSPLQRYLSELRRSLGYKSARSFFSEYLQIRTRLDFNYSYYMKIEGGKIIPSPQVITNISRALENDAAGELITSYCKVIFPERPELFQKFRPKERKGDKISNEQTSPSNQRYLTQAQISCIGKSRNHYFAFLILTLARSTIATIQLKARLIHAQEEGSNEDLDQVLVDLEKFKLILIEGQSEKQMIRSIASEMKFPSAESAAEKKLYEKIDIWNLSFNQEMSFEPLIEKMLLRRVSSRYLSVIQAHSNLLLELVRASDETESSHNEDVLMLNLTLQKGRLPG
jgi:hypothetical protein